MRIVRRSREFSKTMHRIISSLASRIYLRTGLHVALYDTSVYKSSLEYLSFKPTEQQIKMHIAMTLMEAANALTTLSMTKLFDRSELRVQQAAYATNILQLLSESDNRIPGKCVSTPSPSELPTPMPSEIRHQPRCQLHLLRSPKRLHRSPHDPAYRRDVPSI